MPRTTLALTSFVSGEFSAKMDGRTDFEKYTSGVKTMENFWSILKELQQEELAHNILLKLKIVQRKQD